MSGSDSDRDPGAVVGDRRTDPTRPAARNPVCDYIIDRHIRHPAWPCADGEASILVAEIHRLEQIIIHLRRPE